MQLYRATIECAIRTTGYALLIEVRGQPPWEVIENCMILFSAFVPSVPNTGKQAYHERRLLVPREKPVQSEELWGATRIHYWDHPKKMGSEFSMCFLIVSRHRMVSTASGMVVVPAVCDEKTPVGDALHTKRRTLSRL